MHWEAVQMAGTQTCERLDPAIPAAAPPPFPHSGAAKSPFCVGWYSRGTGAPPELALSVPFTAVSLVPRTVHAT